MKGMFLRIFVLFWLTLMVISGAFAVIHVTVGALDAPSRRRAFVTESLRTEAFAIHEALARGDVNQALSELQRFENAAPIRTLLVTRDNQLHGTARHLDGKKLAAKQRALGKPLVEDTDGGEVYAVPVVLPGVELKHGPVLVGVLERHSPFLHFLGPRTLPWRLAALFVIAGLVSFGLARYLSNPLRALSQAVGQIGRGDLSVRVSPKLTRGSTEIVNLGREVDRMAARIQDLLRSQQRLLRDVSHELRSPLARQTVALELARRTAGTEAQPSLDRIEREANRLGLLIGEILYMLRLEGAPQLTRETVDLQALLQEVVHDADFEWRPQQKPIALVTSTPVAVLGQGEILRRAVENVIRNAARFTRVETTVEVGLTVLALDRVARITVRDHGPGVPEAALSQIFAPFFRVDEARDRNAGGTGLGLAIVQRAVLLHGGTVTAKNDNGLIVTIDLPLPTEPSA